LADFSSFLKDTGRIDFAFDCTEPWINLPPLPAEGPPGKKELLAQLCGILDAALGRHEVIAVPYGTDASTLAAAGIPSLVFGPGDIAKAHTVDEWVPLDEVEQASDILYRLACALGES